MWVRRCFSLPRPMWAPTLGSYHMYSVVPMVWLTMMRVGDMIIILVCTDNRPTLDVLGHLLPRGVVGSCPQQEDTTRVHSGPPPPPTR